MDVKEYSTSREGEEEIGQMEQGRTRASRSMVGEGKGAICGAPEEYFCRSGCRRDFYPAFIEGKGVD
jgi:hypothetical protein